MFGKHQGWSLRGSTSSSCRPREASFVGRLAVVIPARNEQEHIFEVAKIAKQFAATVLVVDDGSTDRTCSEAYRSGAEVVKNPRSLGVGAALKKGFRHVFAHGFTIAVSLDGDGAHDPGIIPKIVAYHLYSKSDLTIGSRLATGRQTTNFPSTKESANRFAALLLCATAGTRVTDVASGFRVVNRKITTLSRTPQGYGYLFESLCAATVAGFKVAEYFIQSRYDARDMFGTRRVEILGLLRAAKRFAMSEDHALKLRLLLRWVNDFTNITVRINRHQFIFHPLREYDAYLIQEQSSFFAKGMSLEGPSVDFQGTD
jgi:glycosyltransferase involved in cell wall biosynthesis